MPHGNIKHLTGWACIRKWKVPHSNHKAEPTVGAQRMKEYSHFLATVAEVVSLLDHMNTAPVPDTQLLVWKLIFSYAY